MDTKWTALGKNMQMEIALRNDRARAHILHSIWQEGNAETIEEENTIVAFGALWPMDEYDIWFEIGSIWVTERSRGHKFSSQIFSQLIARMPARGHAFLVTHQPAIVHLAEKHGMHEQTDIAAWLAKPPWDTESDSRTVKDGSRLFVL